MNCRRFQHQLYEFLDGTLWSRAQAAADEHLAECDTCRQSVQQQRQLAQSLSHQLQSSTESLHLSPVIQHRIKAALADTPASRHEVPPVHLLWRRLAWPVAIAACLILLAVMTAEFVRRSHAPGDLATRSQPRGAPPAAFIHLTYSVPAYTFRREGTLVIDALTRQDIVVNATLPSEQDSTPARHGKDSKYSL